MKATIVIVVLLAATMLTGCIGNENQHLEKQIRSEALRESSGIATLQAMYTLLFLHYEENLIQSDDFYLQKDAVNMDYGFDLGDKAIKVVDEGTKKVLRVRLGKGDVIATNRTSLGRPETSHSGYIPKDVKSGQRIDVDAKMNEELAKLKSIYGEQNLKYARENAKNFFRILAAKYGLELDFD